MSDRLAFERELGLVAVLLIGLLVHVTTGCTKPAVSEQTDSSAEDEQTQGVGEATGADNTAETSDVQAKDPQLDPGDLQNPFPHRVGIPEFPRDVKWINTAGPLRKADLKGKFVLMDFWTYCCINCIHVLPELKKLERAYPNELVVIGVHSAKFDTERLDKNIEEAVLRYEIEHPVINDSEHQIWDSYGVQSWPTLLLIDPEGNAVWGRSGEVKFETLDALLKLALPYYRKGGLLDPTLLRFDLLAYQQQVTPLRFPGKILADEVGNRLFVADSNHNRIVIASLDGQLLDVIGTGEIGRQDGGYQEATFKHPQGMALRGQTLYVADTANHLLRAIDLAAKRVHTIAGVGQQAQSPWPGLEKLAPEDPLPQRWVGPPLQTALSSPWALWVHQDDLYIAMAGPHQIWKMRLDGSEVGPYAGNGREDIVDGPLLPARPYETGYASFAQPSGLASDGTWLYVADSEGSSIRAVPLDPTARVRTVVGTADLPFGRLFEFGDVDGPRDMVRLQHALGVVYYNGTIYVADTYNNKIKAVDAETGQTRTIAGVDRPGRDDKEGSFDEPAGISYAKGRLYIADTNNHLIRTIDLGSGKVGTLEIAGLAPPNRPQGEEQLAFRDATQVQISKSTVKPQDGTVQLRVQLTLPDGWKINPLALMAYLVEAEVESGPVERAALAKQLTRLKEPLEQFDIAVPVSGSGDDLVKVSMNYYYCQDGGEGLCRVGSVTWNVPLEISDSAPHGFVTLSHSITP